MKIKQIYHHYTKWEDYKCGFYGKREANTDKVFELFNDEYKTKKYMKKVITDWTISCEHNLSNYSMNRVAYIGQAACCMYSGVSSLTTMYAWKFLDREVQDRSDKIAVKNILLWEQNQKLKSILLNGNKKDIQMGYQMKLPLS
jgi:hypothetical protein